ncbi:MAG: PEP-CTERM sorting domain-containing protein [Rhodocyclaceae bacterium]|nr:PEP-CTERM sorting domain-containing protein [Rhodocyclaceae bacterium]
MKKKQTLGSHNRTNPLTIKTNDDFRPSKRRLVLAIQLLFAIGAGESFAAACILEGTTITSSVTNSVFCNNSGTLTVSLGGTLTNTTTGTLNNLGSVTNSGLLANNGLINNTGMLTTTGILNGSGTLNNTGMLAVASTGTATIVNSSNLANGTLTGGTWVVDGSSNSKSKTTLAIGSGAIATNNANIELIGLGASFSQLTNLANNNGSLAIRDGASFTSAALHNTGTLTVASGGIANIASATNLSNGTLTGGTWVVDNTGGTSKLVVGSGAITTNSANIELIGSGALTSFSQLSGLANNTGSLTVGAGASLNDSKMPSLFNTGTVTVTSGGAVVLAKSGNLSVGTLTGGTWVVDGSGGSNATLTIGSGNITTNNANIKLIGANADFSQISALANNQGTLTIGAGANYATSASLNNTGTIVTTAGGTLELANNKQKLTLTNNGSITSAGTINGNGTSNFTNDGALTIESTGAVSGFNNFVQNSGVTTLKDGGVLSAKSVQFQGGMLTGSGTIDPPSPILIGANATVAPTGMLTLEGNTEFDGLLSIGILGASDYGILNVLGSIDFGAGARIDFGFDRNFNLTDSSYFFRFLFADDIQGLENLTFDYTGLDPLYTTGLDLECQSGRCDYSLLLTRHDDPGKVPEPGTLLLTTLGLLGLAFGRRKVFPKRF